MLDKWKIISDYEFIKNEYFSKVLDVDKQKIKNHLIYHLEINKYNYNDLKENGAIKYFINKKELYDYLINDSLVLIEQFTKFSFLRNKLFFNKQIQYITFQNNINISLNEELTFKTNTNIISLNYKNNNNNNINNYYNNLVHLNQLIKIFYFKEEIINNINSQHNFNNNYNSIILINKIIINKYKNYFNYNVLYQFLKNYGKIRNIPYESLNNIFQDIINYLDKENNNYLKEIIVKHNNMNTELNLNQYLLDFKTNYININSGPLKYIDDFEIINNDIYNFFIKNKLMQKNNFNGKILIIFNKSGHKF